MGLFSAPQPDSRLFCEGCEFAGSIPAEANSVYSTKRIVGDVREAVIIDERFNLSQGIVSSRNPESAPGRDDIIDTLKARKNRCVGKCVLERAGYLPIELSNDKKRATIEALLNSIPAISELGEVEYITEDDDDEEPTDYPVESLQNS